MLNDPIYEASPRERELAADWHGGQSSMLYAVSSTGGLARGNVRPSWSGNVPMTDDEWAHDLICQLQSELQDISSDDTADDDNRFTAYEMGQKLESVRELYLARIEAAEADRG